MASDFLKDRELHLLERRGFRADEARAVVSGHWAQPHAALRRVEALAYARKSAEFEQLAMLFKRAKNITKDVVLEGQDLNGLRATLKEPSELALLDDIQRRWPVVKDALDHERYRDAMNEVAQLQAPVDRFFVDVLVMSDDPALRKARLALLASLRDTILDIADIAEIAPDSAQS